ncbi:hypothetical protein [Wenzhouxiangella marina]|uniref:Uncharacterized protein n=1 Tax=Wenzhouxiangella marina TaxID=1579979 RepID=A0A0K0XUE3_9GAMM|nr:hypothetical protein [Wenzhouxiangella marina]AKS41236.1 hypothetical protein WM2015_855 [Wenzhouxiangella marina]MBB6088116.1 hypothetical protein [Wenzhouxiangella marina]
MHLRKQITPFLCLGTLFVGTTSLASEAEGQEPVIDPAHAAEWLLEQDDPEFQAVGLLLQQAPRPPSRMDVEAPEAPELERIGQILRATESPIVIAMLVAVCDAGGLIEECRELGVEQAVIDHDAGNLLWREPFLGDDLDRWSNAIARSVHANDHLTGIALLTYRALLAYEDSGTTDYLDAIVGVQAPMLAQSVAMPAYGPLIEACRDEQNGLMPRCRQIARSLMSDTPSLTSYAVGLRLLEMGAEGAGDTERVEQLQQIQPALRSYTNCLAAGVPVEHHESITEEQNHRWLEIAALHGEIAGFEYWAFVNDVDCPVERDRLNELVGELPSVSHFSELRAELHPFDLELVAGWLLESDSIESRAVGLWLKSQTALHSGEFDSAGLLEQITELLPQTQDPRLLFLLATACRQADAQDGCVEAGLDQAIVEHDAGNLLSRGQLIKQNDATAWQDLLRSEPRVLDHSMALVQIIADLLTSYLASTGKEAAPTEPTVLAFAYVMALVVDMSSPVQTCRNAGTELREPCLRFAERAAEAPNGLFTRNIGLRLLAEWADDQALTEQVMTFKTAMMNFSICVHGQLDEPHWEAAGQTEMDAYLSDLATVGELAALEAINDRWNLGCSAPAPLDVSELEE